MNKSAKDSTASSQKGIPEDMVTEPLEEPNFLDDELSSDTDDDSTTDQPSALDDLELV